jgi:transcriptional regulator with XRE-family HTH domain
MYNRGLASAYRGGGSTRDPYHCEWGAVVGDRIRRLRRDRDMTLHDLASIVPKPEGGRYSVGLMSRLERGFASPPLYTYLAIADALDIDAGQLLGPDTAALQQSEGEAVLLRCLRVLRIEPHAALLHLTALPDTTPKPEPPDAPFRWEDAVIEEEDD